MSSVSCLHSSVITVLCIIWPLVYCVCCLVSIVCFLVYLYPQCYVHVHLNKSFIHTSSLCLEPQSPPLKGWSKPFVAPPPWNHVPSPPPLKIKAGEASMTLAVSDRPPNKAVWPREASYFLVEYQGGGPYPHPPTSPIRILVLPFSGVVFRNRSKYFIYVHKYFSNVKLCFCCRL